MVSVLTPAGRWKFDKPKRSVICRDGFEGDIAVPLRTTLLLGTQFFSLIGLDIYLVMLDRADGANLRIRTTKLALRIENGVDVQARG